MNQKIVSGSIKVAFVQACWHDDIVDQSRTGFLDEIIRQGLNESNIEFFRVPGVFEIPLLAKRLAKSAKYNGIVASGFVVNGGIYRHDFVSSAVINGLMQVQLETNVPVFSVVLTPHHFHEHDVHRNFFRQHMLVKGKEAAEACLTILKPGSETK